MDRLRWWKLGKQRYVRQMMLDFQGAHKATADSLKETENFRKKKYNII